MSARCKALLALLLLAACGQEAGKAERIAARDPAVLARGAAVYATHCAACHGTKLEGQPDWRVRRADGKLPAPPHDDSGHTWHHREAQLFSITRNGLVPPNAPAGYASDMPAYANVLADEDIWSVLAFIASHWSDEVRAARAQMLGGR